MCEIQRRAGVSMNDLVLGSVYTFPGKGTVIYCGPKGKLIKLRKLSDVTQSMYLAAEYANILRPSKFGTRISAQELHDNDLLHIGTKLLMQNKNGVFVGEIKYLYPNTCDFICRGKTNRVYLKGLYTYEQSITADMREGLILRAAMQSEDETNTERKVPELSGCEMA